MPPRLTSPTIRTGLRVRGRLHGKTIALMLLPIVYVAACGWGRLLEVRLYGKSVGSTAYSVALGLLLCLILGAILNHASLAIPTVLDLILAGGLL